MKYLNIDTKELERKGGYYTAKEISCQPEMWLKTYEKVLEERDQLSQFLEKALQRTNPCVILTGAGTSAFIGEALAGSFQRIFKVSTRSIATTDIITHPEDYFIRSKPTLLISFARSGDSPESLATVKMAEENCDDLYQLTITCNRKGELAIHSHSDNSYVFILPEETNDRSLAMTSSFSSMMLAGVLMLNLPQMEDMLPIMRDLHDSGEFIIKENLSTFKSIAELNFKRAVFLGSGPLFGIAHESHLKVQELSDGKVNCTFDSFLGFRHGPRAIVDEFTLITYLVSFSDSVKRYELDLIRSIGESSTGAKSVCIGYGDCTEGLSIDFAIKFPDSILSIPKDFLFVLYILPAQIVGFYKSLNLGLEPDSPSKGGSISRVVQGVTIY
jgi:tagatose-6-phosphate ketose/aldose isomerase